MTDIEKMLAGGATPESIYKEALAVVEAQNRAKAQENEKLDKARTQFIKAFATYIELVTGEKSDPAHYTEMEKNFKELEQITKQFIKTRKTAGVTRSTKEKSDDEKLYEFLKSIGIAK